MNGNWSCVFCCSPTKDGQQFEDQDVDTFRSDDIKPLRLSMLREVVKTSPIFMHAAKDQVDRLVLAFAGPLYVRAGDTVIKQGDSVDTHDPGLFLLASGSVDVFVAKGTDEPPGHHVFKFKKPGQTFGQVALLYDCPRTATVMACEDAELWHLDRTSFK